MKILIVCLLLFSTPVSLAASYQQQMSAAQNTFTEQNYDSTLTLLQQALSAAQSIQEKAAAHNALGWTYFKDKRYELAREHLQRALVLGRTGRR